MGLSRYVAQGMLGVFGRRNVVVRFTTEDVDNLKVCDRAQV